MYISSVWSLISLVLAGVLSVGLGLPVQAWAVQCGDVLISAGTVVLDTDLACSNPDEDPYAAGLKVLGDTTLDLNGHTISCTGGLRRGVRMDGAVLRNGTIANCEEGLSVGSKAVVEQMVFTHNTWGVFVEGGDGNAFTDNMAIENATGFFFRDGADDNLLLNNLATRNERSGFVIGPGRRNIVIGNRSLSNGAAGFRLNSADIAVRGNVAEANQGKGFDVQGGYGEIVGNTAIQNGEAGFIIDSDQPLHVQENVARENGGDGFLLPADYLVHRRVLRRNVALNNGGHGIHVEVDGKPKSTITGNTVLGHLAPFFDLSDDNAQCRGSVWRKNIFTTASQACIH